MTIDRHATSAARKLSRREDAVSRQAESAQLTPEQRLEVLDNRLGKDRGATKERLRLHGLIASGGAYKVEEVLFEEPGEPGQPPKKLKAKERRARDKKLSVRQ